MDTVVPINTVNVVEFSDDNIIGLTSLPDTPEGNEEANKRFKSIANENETFEEEELEAALDDGVIEEGTWKLVLFHSTNNM